MLANHDQNNVLEVFKASSKLYVNVKLELSLKQEVLWLSAWLDRSKLRLDRSKLGQIAFLQIRPTQPYLF